MAAPRVLSPGEVPIDSTPVDQQAPAWEQNLNVHLICRDCQEYPPNLVEEFSSGDTVCGSCGLVLSGRIVDTRSEWRTFSNDDQGNDDPSRVGDAANPLLNGSQLATNISYDAGGGKNRDLQRAQNKVNNDKGNKALAAAYKQIGALCDAKQLPSSVADTAKHIYKRQDEAKLFKGKSQDSIIAGCIFIACRQNDAGRTFREIFALTTIPKKEIGRVFKVLQKFLASQNKNGPSVSSSGLVHNDNYHAASSTKPDELCRRFCNLLQVSESVSAMTEKLARKQSDMGVIAGRSPISAAAACIMMVTALMGETRTPKQIAEVAQVSDGTIRTSYKGLYAHRNELIDPEWLKQGGDMGRLPVG